MKLLLALALVLMASFSVTAWATTPHTYAEVSNTYCQALARGATFFAEERAAGYTEEEPLDDMKKAAPPEVDDKPDAVEDIWFVLGFVYQYPHLTSSEEGNRIYNDCMG